MEIFKGKTLQKKSQDEKVTIEWKQGSILGIGGDQSQKYSICTYEFPGGGNVLVYINVTWEIPDKLLVDEKVRYGMNNNILFLVLDDLNHNPYQHRFVKSGIETTLYLGNEWLKKTTDGYVDLSWVAGEYLSHF